MLPTDKSWLAEDIRRSWGEFNRWYLEFLNKQRKQNPSCFVNRFGKNLYIRDSRFESLREFVLTGHEAKIYDICHRGVKAKTIIEESGCSEDEVGQILKRFIADRIVLQTEDYYLSLALRTRDELVMNLLLRDKL